MPNTIIFGWLRSFEKIRNFSTIGLTLSPMGEKFRIFAKDLNHPKFIVFAIFKASWGIFINFRMKKSTIFTHWTESHFWAEIENFQSGFFHSEIDENTSTRLKNGKYNDFWMIENLCKNSTFFTHLTESHFWAENRKFSKWIFSC